MQIKFICPLWGMEALSWEDKLKKVKSAGFDGLETNAPADKGERADVKAMLEHYGLAFVAQQWTGRFENVGEAEHIASFERQAYNNSELSPLFINSHSGKDHFSLGSNLRILRASASVAKQLGLGLYHETHRGRCTFSIPQTLALIEQLPELKLTADFSHWCCVHESLLEDQGTSIERIVPHVHYIHARVGHTQASQISDPRVEEWRTTLDTHLDWWDRIVNAQRDRGTQVFYICPEFGPYPYMPHDPQSQKPLADQWQINQYMKQLLSQRYG